MESVKNLYDDLAYYHQSNKKEGASYIIHKRFKNNQEYQDVNDVVIEKIPFTSNDLVLDAGCGTGVTSFLLAKKFSLKTQGISLSPSEINLAKYNSKQLNLKDSCEFTTADFSLFNKGNYTKIIAIESLKHADNFALAIKNLSSLLLKNGYFIVVEDLPKDLNKLQYLPTFLNFWKIKDIKNKHDFSAVFKANSMVLEQEFMLNKYVKKGNLLVLMLKMVGFKIAHFLCPIKKWKSLLEIFLGGFILDVYYAKNQMSYQLQVWKKLE